MNTRSYRHLSVDERETLSLGLAHGHSVRTMARVLGRAPSTVSREMARNVSRGRPYGACTAYTQAATRACQPRRPRKLADFWLWEYIQAQLTQGCSPEQIAGRLRREYPDDMRKHLSTETIYAGLYILPRGTLRSELLAALRQVRKARRPSTWPPATCRATGKATSSRGRGTGRLSVRWSSGQPAWSYWRKWGGTDAESAYRGFTKKLR